MARSLGQCSRMALGGPDTIESNALANIKWRDPFVCSPVLLNQFQWNNYRIIWATLCITCVLGCLQFPQKEQFQLSDIALDKTLPIHHLYNIFRTPKNKFKIQSKLLIERFLLQHSFLLSAPIIDRRNLHAPEKQNNRRTERDETKTSTA